MSLPRRLGALDRADSEPDDTRPARWSDGVGMSGGSKKADQACRFRRHPLHPNERICDLCGATVQRHEMTRHEQNHRYEAQWEDKVEHLEVRVVELETEVERVRGEWGMLVDLLHPRIQKLMDGES